MLQTKAGKGAKPRQRVGGKRSAGEADVLAASHITDPPKNSVPVGRPSKTWINKSSCPQTTKTGLVFVLLARCD